MNGLKPTTISMVWKTILITIQRLYQYQNYLTIYTQFLPSTLATKLFNLTKSSKIKILRLITLNSRILFWLKDRTHLASLFYKIVKRIYHYLKVLSLENKLSTNKKEYSNLISMKACWKKEIRGKTVLNILKNKFLDKETSKKHFCHKFSIVGF